MGNITLDAVVMAGGLRGRNALKKINDKHIVCYVVEALVNSNYIKNVVVVGKRKTEQIINQSFKGKNVVGVSNYGNILNNAEIGVEILDSIGTKKDYKLFITGDLPFIEEKHIDCFVDKCKHDFGNHDLFFSVVEDYLLHGYEKDGAVKKKYFKTVEGNFVTGNMLICNVDNFRNKEYVKTAYMLRNMKKFRTKLAWCIRFPYTVPKLLIKYLLNDVSFDYLKNVISSISGTRFSLVKLDCAEPAIDVDGWRDYNRVRNYLEDSS